MNLHSILSKLVIMLIQKLIRAVVLRLVVMLIVLIHLAWVKWLRWVLKLLRLLFRIKSALPKKVKPSRKWNNAHVNQVSVIGASIHLIRRQLQRLAPFVGQLGFLVNGFGKNLANFYNPLFGFDCQQTKSAKPAPDRLLAGHWWDKPQTGHQSPGSQMYMASGSSIGHMYWLKILLSH